MYQRNGDVLPSNFLLKRVPVSVDFDRYIFRPRLLSDVSNRRLCTTILGHRIEFPVGIAPSACHGFAHKDAEVATARGIIFKYSTTYPLSRERLQWQQCEAFA